MASFPDPGSVTICEINRDLITAKDLSSEIARETYGKILGMVFSPVPFSTEFLMPSLEDAEEQHEQQLANDVVAPHPRGFAALKANVFDYVKQFLSMDKMNVLQELDAQGISWHRHKHTLAFISGPDQVTIRDYEDSESKDPYILTSESQRDVKALEWRPNSGRVLAVACKGGICIWSASYPDNTASVRSGTASFLHTVSRGSKLRWTLVDYLRSPNAEQVGALSWSPNGRYLASASSESSSFKIWDVAQGLGSPVRRGLGATSMLKWSPTSDYFFTAKFDGTFYLWETNTWTSQPWSSAGGNVTGATWDPDGRMVLLAFSNSKTLGSIHFALRAPSLDAHLIPIELPEIASLTGSSGIEKLAWDATGERLALSYRGGNDIYRGLVAVYDTRRTPLISASLVGFIRGPGENPRPIALGFHNKFKQGPLLSVCWSSGWCCTYPLLF